MSFLPRVLETIKKARGTTSGLFSFFPLGLLPGVLLGSAILFFSKTPEKGIYGGESMGREELPFYVAIVVTTFFLTWGLAIYQAKEKVLWPRWTSFIFGIFYGFIAGGIGSFLTLGVIVVLLFFVLLLLETIIEHPVVFGAFSLIIIFLVRKERLRIQKGEG